ncbi:MAG TPA: hypothetical protein VM124_00410 [Candidatus Limnocylindrales bacterium]|nr:hypothetical protein [Candidatus Limnocylindrales bacterium]
MNRGQAITLGCRDSEGGGPEPYAACAGTSDPFCEGGSVAWPPDERAKQDEFAMAMAGICTARRWFWRTDNGKTIPIEKLGD